MSDVHAVLVSHFSKLTINEEAGAAFLSSFFAHVPEAKRYFKGDEDIQPLQVLVSPRFQKLGKEMLTKLKGFVECFNKPEEFQKKCQAHTVDHIHRFNMPSQFFLQISQVFTTWLQSRIGMTPEQSAAWAKFWSQFALHVSSAYCAELNIKDVKSVLLKQFSGLAINEESGAAFMSSFLGHVPQAKQYFRGDEHIEPLEVLNSARFRKLGKELLTKLKGFVEAFDQPNVFAEMCRKHAADHMQRFKLPTDMFVQMSKVFCSWLKSRVGMTQEQSLAWLKFWAQFSSNIDQSK